MARHAVRLPVLATIAIALSAIAAFVVVGCDDKPQRSVEAFCHQMEAAKGLDQTLATFDASALEPQVDALRQASEVAPEQIAPDVQTVLDLTTQLEATIATSRTDKAAAMEEALRNQSDQLPAVTAAGQRVQDYTSTNCGLVLNSTAIPSTTAPPATP